MSFIARKGTTTIDYIYGGVTMELPSWLIAITVANVVGFVKLAVDLWQLSRLVKIGHAVTDKNMLATAKNFVSLVTELEKLKSGLRELDSGSDKQESQTPKSSSTESSTPKSTEE